MKVFAFLLPILFTFVLAAPDKEPADYYWRAYENSQVPSDAIIGTYDGSQVTYIGNAPVHGGGLYVGQIFPGNNSLVVTGKSDNAQRPGPVFREQENLQILCSGRKERFSWIASNSTNLHLIKNAVPGGYEGSPFGILYIGRVFHAGIIRIGKVIGYKDLEYYLMLPEGNQEVQYGIYDVLIYT